MKAKNVGLMALALAMGTTIVQADEVSQEVTVSTVKELVNGLEASNDQSDYEAKIEQIKAMLDSLSKEELIEVNGHVISCRSTL